MRILTITAALTLAFVCAAPRALAFPASSLTAVDDHKPIRNPFGKNFIPKNLVIFGDSYSDSCNTERLVSNDTEKVPFPTCYPRPRGRADKGTSWPEAFREAQGQIEVKGGPPGGSPAIGSSNQTTVVNLAFEAAVCSNDLFATNSTIVIPSVGDQIGLLQNGFNGTLASGFGPNAVANKINPHTDVALIWIGTNELTWFVVNTSINTTLNEQYMRYYELPKGSILSYLDCIFGRFDQLYNLGYRKFVLFEMIPLELTPLLNPGRILDPTTGVAPFGFPLVIQQLALTANYIYPVKAREFEASHAGAQIEIFPMHELFERFYFHPEEYGFNNTKTICEDCESAPDGDLWADPLHPSSRASMLIGRKLVRFFKGARGEELLRGLD